MTRSHANKPTFSPPFLHPLSPPTATKVTPPPTEHMGEARGYRRGHTVGVQGTPAIFLFPFYLTDFDSTPSNSQPLNMSRTPTGPAKASPHPPSAAPHPFQHVPLPVPHPLPPRHEEHDPRVTFFVSGVSPHPLPPQTRIIRPQGRILHVWGVPCPSPHPLPPRHEERDPRVMFFASGVSLTLSLTLYHPDTKNATPGSRSSRLVCPLPFYHPFPHLLPPFSSPPTTQTPSTHLLRCRHEEHDHRVAFFASAASLHPTFHPLPPRHEERDRMVTFFVSGVFPHSP